MKFSPKQYADALYELLETTSEEQVSDVLREFTKLLDKNGDLNKIDQILDIFESDWDKKEGFVKAEVSSAYRLSDEVIDVLKKYVSLKTKAKSINFQYKEDEEMLGGLVLRYQDKVLDLSLKKNLSDLKESIQK
jgi:F-type H+-transporting ATPase subunit delta